MIIPEEHLTQMLMDAANGVVSDLASKHPEFWEQLVKEVADIEKSGGVVDIPE